MASAFDNIAAAPPLAYWYDTMEEAERGNGWLVWSEQHGLYVAHSREFLRELAATLMNLPQPVVEVAAGDGALSLALAPYPVDVRSTDPDSRTPHVEPLSAEDALVEHPYQTVLACFPPIDAGIERAVLRSASVNYFLYIGPRMKDRAGPDSMWRVPGWRARDIENVNRVLLTRLDYLVDFTRWTHQRCAEAVLFSRSSTSGDPWFPAARRPGNARSCITPFETAISKR